MPLPLWSDQSSVVFICVYRPRPGFSMHDLLLHLHKILRSLEKAGSFRFAVLRSLTNGSWLAVYAFRAARSKAESSLNMSKLSEIESLQQQISHVADTIDCSRYAISCSERNERDSIAELSKGAAVHFRWIQTHPDRQEILAYTCLAVLKAYINKVEGLRSCTFYNSFDGSKIAGLGIWDSAQAAYRILASPQGSPAEPYWTSLGARLRFGICEVVYVTN